MYCKVTWWRSQDFFFVLTLSVVVQRFNSTLLHDSSWSTRLVVVTALHSFCNFWNPGTYILGSCITSAVRLNQRCWQPLKIQYLWSYMAEQKCTCYVIIIINKWTAVVKYRQIMQTLAAAQSINGRTKSYVNNNTRKIFQSRHDVMTLEQWSV